MVADCCSRNFVVVDNSDDIVVVVVALDIVVAAVVGVVAAAADIDSDYCRVVVHRHHHFEFWANSFSLDQHLMVLLGMTALQQKVL